MRPVECTHCQSVHQVDEILLGPEGTPIKCSHCHRIFRVFPQADEILDSPFVWLLRDREGTTTGFNRLGVLQKMIMEGQVDGKDELSRYGKSWRSLIDIENLKPFFNRTQR